MTKMRRSLLVAMSALLLVAVAVGGTLAWLVDDTDPVVNTFTSAGIDISLTETWNTDGDDEDKVPDQWKAQLVPGKSYAKDPKVTVADTTSVDIYLFVEFKEEGNPQTYLNYTSTLTKDNGWDLVEGTTNVWWRIVRTTDTVKSWELLAGNTIEVDATKVTESTMDDAVNAKLTYTAYAAQLLKNNTTDHTPEEAWAIAKPVTE